MSLLMIGRRRGQEKAISACGIFALDQIGVQPGRITRRWRKSSSPSSAAKPTPRIPPRRARSWRVKAIRENPLMPREVEGFVLVGIVRLLKHGNKVGPRLVQQCAYSSEFIGYTSRPTTLKYSRASVAGVGDVGHRPTFYGSRRSAAGSPATRWPQSPPSPAGSPSRLSRARWILLWQLKPQ